MSSEVYPSSSLRGGERAGNQRGELCWSTGAREAFSSELASSLFLGGLIWKASPSERGVFIETGAKAGREEEVGVRKADMSCILRFGDEVEKLKCEDSSCSCALAWEENVRRMLLLSSSFELSADLDNGEDRATPQTLLLS